MDYLHYYFSTIVIHYFAPTTKESLFLLILIFVF